MKRIVLLFLVLSGMWIPVSAVSIHVPQQYTAIQDAINASINGDTISVSPGIYSGRVNFLGHRVLLTSEDGPDSTIITTAPDSLPLIRFYTGEDSTTILRGFTIRGGTGVAIGCLYSGPIIESNIIEDNTNYGHYSQNFDGAGLYASQATCVIRNNIFRRNVSPGSGGGIAILNSSGIVISGNTFISNEAVSYGGAIKLYEASNTLIEGNVIVGNHGDEGGGGISMTLGGHNLLINNTFDSDTGNGGSAVALMNTDYNLIKNNIMTSNNPDFGIKKAWGIPFSDTVIYNAFFDNAPGDVDSVFLGQGNIFANPLFVDKANGIYHLMSNSPCINAGDPSSPLDPDGTRADMGPFYFNHFVGIGDPGTAIPREFGLEQNYPNPFNTNTIIRFVVPEKELVSLNVFDIEGRLVAKLLDDLVDPGYHEIIWGGMDHKGNPLSSGVYFYDLNTGDKNISKKMLFLK